MIIYSMLAVFRRCLFIFTITFGRIYIIIIYTIILYISTYILKLHSKLTDLLCLSLLFFLRSIGVSCNIYTRICISPVTILYINIYIS